MPSVKRLPNLAGPAAWNVLLGPQPEHPPLEGHQTADVVVIGAGFAGLSAARRITQIDAQARVVVLDALKIAESSAGRNSGFMIDLPHDLSSEDYAGSGDDRKTIALNRHAIQFARDAVQDYGIDPNYFDEAGKINGAATLKAHAHNESYLQHLNAMGEAAELLDAQQMSEITGSQHYLGGLYTSGTVMLQPAGYIRGMAAGLVRDGVSIYESSPVVSCDRQGSTWTITTPQGSVQTERVILTVNGHLESFGFATGRLMQLFLYAVMTPELDSATLKTLGGHPRWGVTPSDPMGTTVRRIDTGQGGNRIVTRTCATLRPNMKIGPSDVHRAEHVMQRKFDDRFPQLAGLKMEHAWAGHLCLTLNGVAVAKELDQGVFSGCVQNGLGTARGTLTGIAAAENAMGCPSEIAQFFQSEPEPKKLLPQPALEVGANTVLRYKEWVARRD